ncbi:MAG: LacI family DNA-binding transcriptional regulator [Pseudomonadota bacterium]
MAAFASVTLNDVARTAGVSPKTVSRVLNNEPNVRGETRARVLEAASALGYRPNPAARSLAGARSYFIAHFFDNPVRDYVSRANSGLYAACRRHNYLVLPEPVADWRDSVDERLTAFLTTSRVDGVVLSPPVCDVSALTDGLRRAGTPFVSLSPDRRFGHGPRVYIDERAAAAMMTRHLIELGHRSIAFITGPAEHGAAAAREIGFVETLRAGGLDVSACPIEKGDFSMRSGVVAAERLFGLPSRPTAVFAANDSMAAGVMMAAYKAGISVPRELSIAGFDASYIGGELWPPLTTVRQPVSMMAEQAAECIIAAIGDAEPDPLDAKLDVELIVRESTGPVAA